MNENEILDLSELNFREAKKLAARQYRTLRSERARRIFSDMMRSFFKTKWGEFTRKMVFVGICELSRKNLENARLVGEKLSIHAAGVLMIDRDVSPELVEETISSISLAGVFSAPDPVWHALRTRVRAGIRLA